MTLEERIKILEDKVADLERARNTSPWWKPMAIPVQPTQAIGFCSKCNKSLITCTCFYGDSK